MSRFDDALREALKREDPGEEFTRRVLAAVPPRSLSPAAVPWRERLAAMFRVPVFRVASATALAVLLIAGGVEYRRERQAREGAAAKEQLMLAMRIAGAKLHATQVKVLELNRQ